MSTYDNFSSHLGGPGGLNQLADLEHLVFKQKVELIEASMGGMIETPNKYSIRNSSGQELFTAEERLENNGEEFHVGLMCCGQWRSFDIGVFDAQGTEVLRLYRKMKPVHKLGCWRQADVEASVPAPSGYNPVGVVAKVWRWTRSEFEVKNHTGQNVFIIEGPCCSWACCQDLDFKVMTVDRKKEVGKITKNWRGIGTELLTDADTFSLTFPRNLDISVKATLLGAAILIDFAFFENSN